MRGIMIQAVLVLFTVLVGVQAFALISAHSMLDQSRKREATLMAMLKNNEWVGIAKKWEANSISFERTATECLTILRSK